VLNDLGRLPLADLRDEELGGVEEPTPADLAAIEAEWPLIDAELAVVDAEIRALSAVGGPSPLDWRRLRRTERRVLAARLRLAVARTAGDAPRAAS
jgi:hypothetical protein